MRHHNSLMHELLKLVPWSRYAASVEKFGSDRGVRMLDSKSHLVALLHAQLSGASSLREIETTMASHAARLYHLGITAPKRSTLADANASRPTGLFADLFNDLLGQAHRGLRKASKEAVRLIDSTSLRLSPLTRHWTAYKGDGCGAKLHVMYDPHAAIPVYFAVTAVRLNDIVAAREMPITPGATYVFDLAYYDWSWWARLEQAGCRFVTRLKSHTKTEILEQRPILSGGAVTADRTVRLSRWLRTVGRNPIDHPVREVHVKLETGKTLRIVSNDLEAPAEEIAEIYKTRWQIELFFRWVKQTLEIRKFLGTSENAIRIQIAVALIAYMLLRMAHAAQHAVDSLLTFTRLVRANLMHFRSIHDLVRAPPPRPSCDPNQLGLALS